MIFIALHFRDGVLSHVQCQKSWKIVLGLILTLYIKCPNLKTAQASQPLHFLLPFTLVFCLSPTAWPLSHIWTLQISVGWSVCSANLRREKVCQQSNPAKSWTSAGGSHPLLSHCEMLPQQGDGGPGMDLLSTMQTRGCPKESSPSVPPSPSSSFSCLFFSLKQWVKFSLYSLCKLSELEMLLVAEDSGCYEVSLLIPHTTKEVEPHLNLQMCPRLDHRGIETTLSLLRHKQKI